MRKFIAILLSAVFLLSVSVLVVGVTTQPNQQQNAFSESGVLLFNTSSSESLNWAGYAVTGNNITNVTGSFVIPPLSTTSSTSVGGGAHAGSSLYKSINGKGGSGGSSTTSYAAFWVGIDGYNSNTVEQAGVLMEVQNGVAKYSVWYEFYPAAPVYASWTPAPGNNITVYVNYTLSNATFVATVWDTTIGQKYVSPYTSVSGAKRSSAEWITEAPSSGRTILPLADFGTAYFGPRYTGSNVGNSATVSGTFGNIGNLSDSHSVYAINMVQRNGSLKAETSSLYSDESSFYVTWVSS